MSPSWHIRVATKSQTHNQHTRRNILSHTKHPSKGMDNRSALKIIPLAIYKTLQKEWTTGSLSKLHVIKKKLEGWSTACSPSRKIKTVLARLRIGHRAYTPYSWTTAQESKISKLHHLSNHTTYVLQCKHNAKNIVIYQ